MNKKLQILISNDDSYKATGLQALIDSALQLNADIIVVAPLYPNSGKSGAITVSSPLKLSLIQQVPHVKVYTCDGTPVDCVKLALNVLYKESKPDLVISGINHGSNAAVSVLYSGTMGAAIEGCLKGIPSIGFSLDDHASDADFSEAVKVCTDISRVILKEGLPTGTCLNVNIPKGKNIKGYRVAKQTKGNWINEYKPTTDEVGNTEYWLVGEFDNQELEDNLSDEFLLKKGYVSIVPVKIDMTDYTELEKIARWNKDFKSTDLIQK